MSGTDLRGWTVYLPPTLTGTATMLGTGSARQRAANGRLNALTDRHLRVELGNLGASEISQTVRTRSKVFIEAKHPFSVQSQVLDQRA